MIRDRTGFLDELEKVNPWWTGNEIPELKMKLIERSVFSQVMGEMKSKRGIMITGPRRSGKTVLLKQIIDKLLKQGISRKNIIFYSLDDPSLSSYSDNVLKDLLDYFLEEISQGGKKYIFLDEAHLYNGWYRWIKSYYDKYEDLKFILSGSSSLTLQKEANKYLRGRTIAFEVLPFSFKEFLKMSGEEFDFNTLGDLFGEEPFEIRRVIKKLKPWFDSFLEVGGFPEWFEIRDKNRWYRRLIEDIPKKAIYEDVSDLFGVRNTRVLELVLDFLAANQSRIISYESINEVAGLDRNTLVRYLDYLKSTYLIIEILKYAGNIKSQMKAKKKYLMIDQGIRNSLVKEYEVKETNIGFIVENTIGAHLFKTGIKKIYYPGDELDFVFVSGGKLVGLEVKYRKNIKERDLENIRRILENKEIKYGIVVTKDRLEKKRHKGKEIFLVPAPLFCLIDGVFKR